MNIVNDKVSTNTTAIKHSVTLGYGTLNYDPFSPSTFQKFSKQQSLLKRDLFTYDYKLVNYYQDYESLTITNVVFLKKRVNVVFVATTYKPYIY